MGGVVERVVGKPRCELCCVCTVVSAQTSRGPSRQMVHRWGGGRAEGGGASALGIALAFTGVFHKRLCIGLEYESEMAGGSYQLYRAHTLGNTQLQQGLIFKSTE